MQGKLIDSWLMGAHTFLHCGLTPVGAMRKSVVVLAGRKLNGPKEGAISVRRRRWAPFGPQQKVAKKRPNLHSRKSLLS